jgi:hypothetical protein
MVKIEHRFLLSCMFVIENVMHLPEGFYEGNRMSHENETNRLSDNDSDHIAQTNYSTLNHS